MAAADPERPFARDLRPVSTTVTAKINGEQVAALDYKRLRVRADVHARDVRCGGLVATYFLPGASTLRGAIVVLGGSEGGIGLAEELAALLASHDFAALAVAYFGVNGLPAHLMRIPLDYVEDAAEWLMSQPDTAGLGLGVLGVSRGGELALLLASIYPKVRATVGFAASSVIWPGFTQGLDCYAAWTRKGHDVAFAVPRLTPLSAKATGPLVTWPWFHATARDQKARQCAMIPVELTRGAVLLVSGGDDQVWPSPFLAELAMQRLNHSGNTKTARHLHLTYPRAGHGVGRAPGLPAAPIIIAGQNGVLYSLGGSKAGNARSAQHSWPQVISFFVQHLAASSAAVERQRGY
jgi:dienelactone hydrolase